VISLHALRHTHAWLLLAQATHPKIVQERLGHANIAITLDTYSHVLPGLQRQEAAKLDVALFGSVEDGTSVK
jgi:integrase